MAPRALDTSDRAASLPADGAGPTVLEAALAGLRGRLDQEAVRVRGVAARVPVTRRSPAAPPAERTEPAVRLRLDQAAEGVAATAASVGEAAGQIAFRLEVRLAAAAAALRHRSARAARPRSVRAAPPSSRRLLTSAATILAALVAAPVGALVLAVAAVWLRTAASLIAVPVPPAGPTIGVAAAAGAVVGLMLVIGSEHARQRRSPRGR